MPPMILTAVGPTRRPRGDGGQAEVDSTCSLRASWSPRRAEETLPRRRAVWRRLRRIPTLTVGREVAPLARTLLRSGTLPATARIDAVHVAIAATNGIDYLLTWNMRHLANAVIRGKIEERCRKAGLRPPIICTPEELMETP